MPTPLSYYPRPRVDTGLGLHDSSNVGASPSDFVAHARALRAAGISYYKILEAGGNKVDRCRILLEHDIVPIVRLYKHRPHPDYVVFPGEVARYVAVGVKYFEMGNEPNISPDEWADGKWPSAADMGRMIAEQWIKASDMVKREGGIPLVYAMTPEGTYSHAGGHRRITIGFLQHLRVKGRLDTLERAGIAIHPRPHNNPPDAPSTPTNTVTFNEYRWFAQTYQELVGWVPPMFATEHGYSIGDSQNSNFPRIDEHLWTEYNQELFERMNPNHPQAIPPYMFALCYWLETAGGTWANDNLSNGWFPDGLRPWGQRLASMRVTWNRAITQPAPVPTPQPTPEVPTMPTLSQILSAKLGARFKDVRADMPTGAGVYSYVDSRKMTYIALHYSTGLPGPVSPLNIARDHAKPVAQGGRGWPGIGYHFVIDEGVAHYVGTVDTQRAHVLDRNDEALGICFTGLYDTSLPSAADTEVAKLLIAGLDEFYGHKKQLVGHKQLMAPGYTNCPGRIVELISTLRAPAPVPAPKPTRPPLPEDEILNPNLTLKVFLQKATYWQEEYIRELAAKRYARAGAIRLSLAKLLAAGRDKWAA